MNFYYSSSSFIIYARDTAIALGGLPGSSSILADNAYDAYRHALLSAKLMDHFGYDTPESVTPISPANIPA